jgi:predicted RNA binding protein YcfA (HicA-like mRNA interferase family)
MPKLKTLDSKEIIKILESFGFEISSQRGSHIKMVRQTSIQRQILTLPNHKNIDKGTVKAIYNQASRFVSGEELENHFYTK